MKIALLGPKKSTKEIVEMIHSEFHIAGEQLLREAHTILGTKLEPIPIRLKALGFTSAHGVKDVERALLKRHDALRMSTIIEDYFRGYPNYRFITDDKVNEICKKYGLVFGPVACYTGKVPEKNLIDIENFKQKALSYKDTRPDSLVNIVGRLSEDRRNLEKISKDFPLGVPANHLTTTGRSGQFLEFAGGMRIQVESYTRIEHTLSICAPKKEMNLSGKKMINGKWYDSFKVTVPVPDPVVLQPVKHGYLIITAWGPEASDENVVNHRMN